MHKVSTYLNLGKIITIKYVNQILFRYTMNMIIPLDCFRNISSIYSYAIKLNALIRHPIFLSETHREMYYERCDLYILSPPSNSLCILVEVQSCSQRAQQTGNMYSISLLFQYINKHIYINKYIYI